MADLILKTTVNKSWGANRLALIGSHAKRLPPEKFLHWEDLRGTVAQTQALMAQADVELHAAEQDINLSAAGRKAKVKAIARKQLLELSRLYEVAPAVARRVAFLQGKVQERLKESTTQWGAEIRQHVAAAKAPAMEAERLREDPQ